MWCHALTRSLNTWERSLSNKWAEISGSARARKVSTCDSLSWWSHSSSPSPSLTSQSYRLATCSLSCCLWLTCSVCQSQTTITPRSSASSSSGSSCPTSSSTLSANCSFRYQTHCSTNPISSLKFSAFPKLGVCNQGISLSVKIPKSTSSRPETSASWWSRESLSS